MNGRTMVICSDSATKLDEKHHGQVVICGSHGGVYCGYLAALAGLRAVILNDAGIGFEGAGAGCLGYCEDLGMAAAVCAHDSARIGDGHDMAARGRISLVNRMAIACGCQPGMAVDEAADCLRTAPLLAWNARSYHEARQVFPASDDLPAIICLDSVGLVTEDDIGQIVLTGSHGGLMGGRPEGALKVDALAAFFNDAGVGMDQAGLGRLLALDRRAIVAATVDAMSARIGDGLSTYEDGRLSFVNDRAASAGLNPGMSAKQAVQQLQAGER